MQLAKRLKAVKPSPTLSLNAKARALAAKGADVLSFAAGEPDFDTPAHIKDAIKAALDTGFTKYTATGGIPELKTAIVEKLERENKLTFAADQIVVTVGGKQALYNCFQALLSPGDEVVIFSPLWVSYPDMVRLADGEPKIVETNAADNWTPEPGELRKALSLAHPRGDLQLPQQPHRLGDLPPRARGAGRGAASARLPDHHRRHLRAAALRQRAVLQHRQRRAGSRVAHPGGERLLQGVLDDRAAARLRGGPEGSDRRHADGPGPVDLERHVGDPEGRRGRAQGPDRSHRRDGRGLRASSGADDRRARTRSPA